MGKALVVGDFSVKNPLTKVTFIDTEAIVVTDLVVSTTAINIKQGANAEITATVTTEDGRPATAQFTSSNQAIATVSASNNRCVVSGVGEGNCEISVKAGNITKVVSVNVSFNIDLVIADYVSKNTSATSADINAYKTLVQGLVNAGVYNKFKYIVPMLGNKVSDLLLDAVNPTSDELFSYIASAQSGLVANTNYLGSNPSGESGLKDSGTNVNTRNLSVNSGLIMSTYIGTPSTKAIEAFNMIGAESSVFGLKLVAQMASGYSYPQWMNFPSATPSSTEKNYKQRIYFGYVGGGKSELYKDTQLYAEGSLSISETAPLKRMYRALYMASADDSVRYNFIAITDGTLTPPEWSVVYPLLHTFLEATGKIVA